MSAKHETADSRFKSDLTDTELEEIYTPTAETIEFAPSIDARIVGKGVGEVDYVCVPLDLPCSCRYT